MWGCDYAPLSGGWWGSFFPGSLWSLLLWGLVILLVVYLAIRIFKLLAHNSQGPSQDRIDSQAILKTRFARGDISQEEFVKMKRIISQQ